MPFEQKKRIDLQVAFLSKTQEHKTRPNSAPNLAKSNPPSAAVRKKYLLSRIPKGDSFITARKSVADAKNKKEILAIIAPALQAARSDAVPDLPKPNRKHKWTLREIAGLKADPENDDHINSSRRSAASPRPPLYFLKDRVHFESPGLRDILEDRITDMSGEKQSETNFRDSVKEGPRNETSPELLNESFLRNSDQFIAFKKELALNSELMLSLESHETQNPILIESRDQISASKFATLRKLHNQDPSVDPHDRIEYQRLHQLKNDALRLVEDIQGEIEEIKKAVDDPRLTRSASADDPLKPVQHFVSLTGLFRRALKSVGSYSVELGSALEQCWRGMGFAFEGMVCLERIASKRGSGSESATLDSHRYSSGHATTAIAKLQESFDIDIYKKLVDGLQNELHEIKKENISLRGRVKASELLTRQRLISHLYNDDVEQLQENTELVTTQRGEPRYFAVHSSGHGMFLKSAGETRRTRRRSSAALVSLISSLPQSAKIASVSSDDQEHATSHAILSAQSVGLEKLSLPSTTLPCVGLDLVLGRIPQVITHALNSYQRLQNAPPHLSSVEVHQLSLQILLDVVQEYDTPTAATNPPQLPDLLPVFFHIKNGSKAKADEEMGRFCSSLQEILQNDENLSQNGTLPLIVCMGKFLGLAKSSLTSHALRVVLLGLRSCLKNETVQKIHFEAQRDLFETRNRGIMEKAKDQSDQDALSPKAIDPFDPDLLIPLEIAQEVAKMAHRHFHFKSTVEIAESHLESEIVLADGTCVPEHEMQVLLTLHHIHQGIKQKVKVKPLKVNDIIGLFRRADSRRCGRVSMLQFISCIRSLRCGVTDDEIMTVVRLFDTGSKSLQEVDYNKFAKFFSPVTLFVTIHTMVSSLVTMWCYETALNEAEAMRNFVCNDFKQRITELSEFVSIIQSMRRDITARKAAFYFQECLDISGTNFVTRDTFLIMSRVHNLFNNDPG